MLVSVTAVERVTLSVNYLKFIHMTPDFFQKSARLPQKRNCNVQETHFIYLFKFIYKFKLGGLTSYLQPAVCGGTQQTVSLGGNYVQGGGARNATS